MGMISDGRHLVPVAQTRSAAANGSAPRQQPYIDISLLDFYRRVRRRVDHTKSDDRPVAGAVDWRLDGKLPDRRSHRFYARASKFKASFPNGLPLRRAIISQHEYHRGDGSLRALLATASASTIAQGARYRLASTRNSTIQGLTEEGEVAGRMRQGSWRTPNSPADLWHRLAALRTPTCRDARGLALGIDSAELITSTSSSCAHARGEAVQVDAIEINAAFALSHQWLLLFFYIEQNIWD